MNIGELLETTEDLNEITVTISLQELANRIHSVKHPENITEHRMIHSCPRLHLAMFYSGLSNELNVFWPDGKGGNAWKESTK